MNTRAITLSFVIAAMGMFMVYSYLDSKEKFYKNKYGDDYPVVVAKVDINELEILDDSKVTVENRPQNFLSPGHIKDMERVFNTIAVIPIKKGEQITSTKITQPNSRTGLARQVTTGKRAVSIAVDSAQAVGRLIKPGDRVDVLAFIDYAGGRKDMIKTVTVLQDALVLSTGLSMTNASPLMNVKSTDGETKTINLATHTDYNNVTLELTPNDAQKIILIVGAGARPYLSLRNNDDKEKERLNSTKLFDLLGDEAEEARKFFGDNQPK